MINHVPAGLTDSNGEFFVTTDWSVYLVRNRRTLDFLELDEEMLSAIEDKLNTQPCKKIHIMQMVGSDERLIVLKQFVVCNYAKFDHNPDVIGNVLQKPEFSACPLRGECDFEGKCCDALETSSGEFLTARELQYIQLSAAGYLDKDIAKKWFRALKTVKTHAKNVRRKTGLDRKADITRFAYQNHLVS